MSDHHHKILVKERTTILQWLISKTWHEYEKPGNWMANLWLKLPFLPFRFDSSEVLIITFSNIITHFNLKVWSTWTVPGVKTTEPL